MGIGDRLGNPPDVWNQTRIVGDVPGCASDSSLSTNGMKVLGFIWLRGFRVALQSVARKCCQAALYVAADGRQGLKQKVRLILIARVCKPMRLSVCCTCRPTYMHTNVHVSCQAVKIFYLNKGRH